MSRTALSAVAIVVAGLLLGTRLVGPGLAAALPLTSQALTAYRTCIVTATPTTTTIVTDATVRQGSPTTNFGTSTTDTIASGGSANRRLYVRADLSGCSPAIPAGATVRLATLRLYASVLPAACRTVDVFDATVSWSESTVTWNNQPFGTTLNNPPSATASATFTIGTPTGCTYHAVGTIGIPVTTDVAGWVAGTAANYGWMLRDDAESSGTTYTSTWSGKELGTLAQAPQLVVTYVTVP
ncbi:MAG TPA: DNRLRE domain-containing protein [Candidatus Dormibacteraeota bacterium]|nr:DNRLRE domain-containing protein [Candidatus Dormibacteraeota bacterium]